MEEPKIHIEDHEGSVAAITIAGFVFACVAGSIIALLSLLD